MILFSSRLLILSRMRKCFSTTSFSFLTEKLFAYLFYMLENLSFLFTIDLTFILLIHFFVFSVIACIMLTDQHFYFRTRIHSALCHFADSNHNDDDDSDEKYRMKRNMTIFNLCQQSRNNIIASICHTHLISLSFTSLILSFFHPFFFSIIYIHTCIVS